MIYLYKLECITNMHVGSGDANYSIVDNQVQRDVVMEHVPVIHASGVKGALRDFFKGTGDLSKVDLQYVFGKQVGQDDARVDVVKRAASKDTTPGEYKFFDAKLIARPLRVSEGTASYVLSTDHDTLKDFSDTLAVLGLNKFFSFNAPEVAVGQFKTTLEGVKGIEGKVAEKNNDLLPELQKIIGSAIAYTDSMKDYDLPVMARNALDENGISNNLWYEEVVPHKSVFYFIIITPHNETTKLDKLDNAVVQFGANASVGQGYARVTEVAHLNDPVLTKEVSCEQA